MIADYRQAHIYEKYQQDMMVYQSVRLCKEELQA